MALVALGVVALAVVLFALERIPVEMASLALVVALVLFGLLTPGEALAGFSSDTVIFIFALLAMTQGLEATGVMQLVSERVLPVARLGPVAFQAALLAMVCAFSSVASNTAVTAAFLPIATGAARRAGIPVRRLLLPLAFSSMLGGTVFLFGTSTNLVVSASMERLGLRPIGFAELAPVGVVLALVGIAATLALTRRLSPETSGQRVQDLVDREYVTDVVLAQESPLVGKAIAEIEGTTPLPILGIIRHGVALAPDPRHVLAPHDRLLAGGSGPDVLQVEAMRRVAGADGTPRSTGADGALVVEAWIPPTSALVGRSVNAARFAELHGVDVLGRHRHPALRWDRRTGRTRSSGWPGDDSLAVGDVVLLRGPEARIRALADGSEAILIGQVEHRRLRRSRAALAFAIFGAAVIAAGLKLTSPAIAGLTGMLAMVATGCVDSRTAFRVDWRVVVLMGSLLALGAAMEKSGAGELVARTILPLGKFAGPRGVLGAVMLLTVALSVPMSNQAAALVMVPIAFHAAFDLGVDPRPFLMGTCLAASCAFMTPLEPSAALVYGPGHYRFTDFLRVGTPVTVVMLGILIVAVPLVWPFAAGAHWARGCSPWSAPACSPSRTSAADSGCTCASTIQSDLSIPRDTSVRMSAVAWSPASEASSIALRAEDPNAASASASAETCASVPPTAEYSSRSVAAVTCCTVPRARPPSWTTRSATRSAKPSTPWATSSKSSWSAANCGPFTFQCATFACARRSMALARSGLRMSIMRSRVRGSRSIREGYMSGSS